MVESGPEGTPKADKGKSFNATGQDEKGISEAGTLSAGTEAAQPGDGESPKGDILGNETEPSSLVNNPPGGGNLIKAPPSPGSEGQPKGGRKGSDEGDHLGGRDSSESAKTPGSEGPNSGLGQPPVSPREPEHFPRRENYSSEGERQEPSGMTPFQAHVLTQIQTLSDNDAVIQGQLDKLQGNEYEAVQSAENPGWNFDVSGFDKWPQKLQDAALKLMGDLGAAARGLAGGAPVELSVDEQIIREAVKLTRSQMDQYVLGKASAIARAMADPDLEVRVGPVEKDEATKIG